MTMKKNLLLPVLSLVCAMLMVACGEEKKKENSGPDKTAYTKVLPADAAMVMKLDISNLLEKSQVLENATVITAFEDKLQFVPEEVAPLLKSIYEDPNNSGVDVKLPIYFAINDLDYRHGMEATSGVVAVAISDKKAFEKTMSTSLGDDFKTVSKNGMKYISIDEPEVEVAYDANKLVLVFDRNHANLSAYTSLSTEKMAINSKKFDVMFKGDDDMKWALNLEPLMDEVLKSGLLDAGMRPFVGMVKEYTVYGSVNFEKGFANYKIDTNVPAEYSNVVKAFFGTPTKRHFKYIPSNSFAVLNYNFDMQQLYPLLEANGLIRQLSAFGYDEQKVKSILKSVSGDYTAALWTSSDSGDDPQYMFAVDCSDRLVFDLLFSFVSLKYDVTPIDEDVYALNVNRREIYNYYTYESEYVREGYDYYLMYKDGAIMVMPENLYNEISYGGELSALRNNVTKNRLYASMSDDIVVDMKVLVGLLASSDDNVYYMDEGDKAILEFLGMIQSLTVDFNLLDLNVKLNLVDDSANSLKIISDKTIELIQQVDLSDNEEIDYYY